MKKIFVLILIARFSVVCGQSVAPDVIGSSGDFYKNAKVILSWTLGECITETDSAAGIVLTQGFQQPDYSLVSIYEHPDIQMLVKAYPNPTTGKITIEIPDKQTNACSLTIRNLNGQLLLNETFTGNSKQIDLSLYAKGEYVLSILLKNGEIAKTFKIVKIR